MSKIRVLILADDCNPDWPSLPVVGYKFAKALADHADVTVATHVRNKPQITRDGFGAAKVVFLDNEYIARPMYKLATLLRGGNSVAWSTGIAMAYPSYLAFEYEAYKRFKPLLSGANPGFDIVHRITPMSPTIPSPMAGWSKVPFVLGPLNGGLRWPASFKAELKREREHMSYLRSAHKALPYFRKTYQQAALILAAFGHTIEALPDFSRDRVIDFPEVGFDPRLFNNNSSSRSQARDRRMTFLFAGRLVPYKCADILVRAFASSEKLRRHKLQIVGQGPELGLLEGLIKENGLEQCVEMLGWKTQTEVGQLMQTTDVFAFPSIRELGAGVVVEAMVSGLPCLVVDYGGPGGLVTRQNGVKVPVGTKAELTERFKREMEAMVDDPDHCRRLGEAAHRDATALYAWDAKARKMIECYEWVLGRRPSRPDFYSSAGDAAALDRAHL